MARSQFEGIHMDKDERKHRKREAEMERRYKMLMPVDPEYDPSMCRGEFLRKLFAELNLPEHEKWSSESSTDSEEPMYPLHSRFQNSISLSSFIRQAPLMIRYTRLMERDQGSKDFFASAHKFNVPSGRTDLYDQLLESIKRSSLYFMFSRVLNRLRIMEKISVDWGDIDLSTLPNMIFKWSMDTFFKRCMLPDPTYLDVLQMSHSEESLDWAKFSTDVQEIIRYYKFFYTELFLNKGHETMMAIVWDQQQLLNIGESLDHTLETTKRDFALITQNSRKLSTAWWGRHRKKLLKECRRRTMTATVLFPIQWRYVRDSFASMTEMQIIKDNMAVEKLRTQIKELKKQMEDDQQSTNQARVVYNILIENYQCRINHYSDKLSTELSHWDDKILIATIQLNKAVDDYKNTEARIEFMERRVQEVLELKKAEAQAQIDRILHSQYQSSKAKGSARSKTSNKSIKRFERTR
ncbi:hypothetical protein ACLKA6_013775 [Drosophila palustris]